MTTATTRTTNAASGFGHATGLSCRECGQFYEIGALYACGECTCNVIGNIYVGSGNSYASAVVFGRIAGRTAAGEACGLPAERR